MPLALRCLYNGYEWRNSECRPGTDSHVKVTGMLVVLLKDRNCIFWSPLGCTGPNALYFTVKESLRVKVKKEKCRHTVLVYCLL